MARSLGADVCDDAPDLKTSVGKGRCHGFNLTHHHMIIEEHFGSWCTNSLLKGMAWSSMMVKSCDVPVNPKKARTMALM